MAALPKPSSNQVVSRSSPSRLTSKSIKPQVFEDFISEEEEAFLLQHLDGDAEGRPWRDSRFNGSSRGKRYGVEMDLRLRTVSPASVPMPEWLAPFTARMCTLHRVLENVSPNGEGPSRGRSFARRLLQQQQYVARGACRRLIRGERRLSLPCSILCSPCAECNAIDYRKARGDFLSPHVDGTRPPQCPLPAHSMRCVTD